LRICAYKNSFYNPFMDATLFTEFNGAAFRLHSLLNGILTKPEVDNDFKLIRDSFGNVGPLYHGKMSSLMHGLCHYPSQKYDKYVTKEMTNYLYKTFQTDWGFDIAAGNIQRGRDVGMQPYTEIVRYLTNGKIDIQCFDDLQILIDRENIENLKQIYCDVKDIDLWAGMNNERVSGNMVVGPTAAEIIASQFRNLKYGDRFYFEHPDVFNWGQLQTLKEVTLSNLLCLNTNMESIQLNVFEPPDLITNPHMDCKLAPKLDISQWFERGFWAGAVGYY